MRVTKNLCPQCERLVLGAMTWEDTGAIFRNSLKEEFPRACLSVGLFGMLLWIADFYIRFPLG